MTPMLYSCALITGASSGLGEEFAIQLANSCESMILVARRLPQLEQLRDRLHQINPDLKAHVIGADLADSNAREEVLDFLKEKSLLPDLLINNAGLGDYGEFASADWQKTLSMLRLNIEALTHMTHALIPSMIAQKKGSIIQVSSLASTLPIPDFAVYAATKAYVSSFTEALKIELKSSNINVLALCPGPVHTGFGDVANRENTALHMPSRNAFFVDKSLVVKESLSALKQGKARVFPGFKTSLVAYGIGALPMVVIRWLMSFRPRQSK